MLPKNTVRQTRAITSKQERLKNTTMAEAEKSKGGEMSAFTTMLGKVLVQMKEEGKKDREREKEETNKSLQLLADKFESLQLAQMKTFEAQSLTIKAPLPKYCGKSGEFEEWKLGVLNCIKANNWQEESRVIEMLPIALFGDAARVFSSFTSSQKQSLDSVFEALKESLEPETKTKNRELFIKAKRERGETMRAFINRCTL